MLLGYARVSSSSDRQSLDMQLDALRAAGVDDRQIFTDTLSGATLERPGLLQVMEYATPGDTIVAWAVDRVGRNAGHLCQIVDDLAKRGVHVRFLRQELDTGSASGRLTLQMFAALAEFERELARERIMAGLASARSRGRTGGRPPKFSADQLGFIYERARMGDAPSKIAALLGANVSTVKGVLHRARKAGHELAFTSLPDPGDQIVDIEEALR